MEELSLDNILTGEEAAGLFEVQNDDVGSPREETLRKQSQEQQEQKEINEETTEVNPEELFGEPESVGSDDKEGNENITPAKEASSNNFYSSFAKALVEDDVLSNLSDEELSKIKDADSFKELIENAIYSSLDERQQRIDDALRGNMEISEIQQYERNLAILGNIKDSDITEESEKGEALRKNIIIEDYLQKGLSKEKAIKLAERSIEGGTDIEDAKEALQSCKAQVNKAYKDAIQSAQDEENQRQQEINNQVENLKKAIMSDNKAFGDFDVDRSTRERVYNAIFKPVYTDPETGDKLSAIQKYESEHHTEFLKYVGLTYVLTDGFKSLDGLVKGKVKKEVRKGIKELEHTINTTARNSDGTLKFVSGVGSDPNSVYRNYTLDI